MHAARESRRRRSVKPAPDSPGVTTSVTVAAQASPRVSPAADPICRPTRNSVCRIGSDPAYWAPLPVRPLAAAGSSALRLRSGPDGGSTTRCTNPQNPIRCQNTIPTPNPSRPDNQATVRGRGTAGGRRWIGSACAAPGRRTGKIASPSRAARAIANASRCRRLSASSAANGAR